MSLIQIKANTTEMRMKYAEATFRVMRAPSQTEASSSSPGRAVR